MSSLDMSGFSISLVLLPPANDEVVIDIPGETSLSISANLLLDLFDAPADCPGWKPGFAGDPSFCVLEKKNTTAQQPSEGGKKSTQETLAGMSPPC